MIVYPIILSAAGIIIMALAILTTIAIQDSRRQARYYEAEKSTTKVLRDTIKKQDAENATLQQELQHAQAENADLSEALESVRLLYNKVLRERQELVARNTALVEAMEARPTQPKRTVRKNTQATE